MSNAIYTAETWVMPKENTRVLQVFENNYLRLILYVKLLDGISINRVHKIADTKYHIQNIKFKRRLAWFGHVFRPPDDSKKRGRRRPPKRWADIFKE